MKQQLDALQFIPLHLYYIVKYMLHYVLDYFPECAGYIREKCRNNITFWFEFYVSFPEKPSKTPFIFQNFKYKKDYIRKLADNIKNGKDLIVSKSEDMGATELTALVLLWYWMFHDDSNFAIIARIKKQVFQSSDPATIFALYRYVLQNTPPLLIKSRLKEGELPWRLIIHRKNQFCAILVNRANGNRLYGFSGARVNHFPRSRKLKAAWFDDMAFQKHQASHLRKLKRTPVIATSCPNGTANAFYDLTMDPDREQYQLHWALNPDYDESWHQHILETVDPVYIEQFLNINFDYKYKRPRRVREAASPDEQVRPRKPRKPRRKEQSTFLETFKKVEEQAEKRVHHNKPEQPKVVSFEEFKARRQQEASPVVEVSTIVYAMGVINYCSGGGWLKNTHPAGKTPMIISGCQKAF